ncbi:MAG: tetratricopeptide repeat protein [Saprospiraceae bacterium]
MKAKVLHNKGLAYQNLENYYESIMNYLQARNLKDSLVAINFPKINYTDQLTTYSMLGNLYSDLFQIESARSTLQKAIDMVPHEEYYRRMATIYNLAVLEEKDSNYAQARTLLLESMELAEKGNFIDSKAYFFDALGTVSRSTLQMEQAKSYYDQAQQILDSFPQPTVQAGLYNNVGMYYLMMNDLDNAYNSALKGLELGMAIGDSRKKWMPTRYYGKCRRRRATGKMQLNMLRLT